MPETRYIDEYENGILVNRIPYEVSDEELADKVEKKALAKAEELVDNISSLADAKSFLKRLCARLLKKGLLP